MVAALARFVEATPNLDPQPFRHFTLSTLREEPDIFALSFNPYVPSSRRKEVERQLARVSPGGHFQITERDHHGQLVRAGERPDYVPVGYITPRAGNLPAISYDFGSEPKRRDAIQRARSTGQAAASEPLHLVQDQREHVGLLILKPAYRPTGELLGFAVAVINVDQMVEIATRGQLADGLVFRLYDPAASGGVLYSSDRGKARAPAGHLWQTRLQMADRAWELRVFPTEGYLQRHRPWLAWGVGVTGLLGATLLQILLPSVTGRAAVIRRQVDEQTRQLRAQGEALARSEKRYRSVVDNVQEVIFQTDAHGLWTFLNPAWTEITGFGVQDSLGRRFLEYVHPEDRARSQSLFEPLVRCQKDHCRHQVRYRHRDGSFRWIEVVARLTLDQAGSIIGTSGTLSDITQRRQAADELRKSAAALNHAQAVARLGSWELDIARDRLTWSPETHRQFGVPMGTPLTLETFIGCIHPDDREWVVAGWSAALAGAPYDIEHRILVAGRTLWVRERAELSFDANGRAIHALGTVLDITQTKRMALDLEAYRDHLEELVKARTA